MELPPGLPAISTAPLPRTYESAKSALENCENLDECKEWANQAEALASYARQASDETMLAMATRIKARAIRRCGELLKQFDARGRPPRSDMTCDVCGEEFGTKVWHCAQCGHHHGLDRETCNNCHSGVRPENISPRRDISQREAASNAGLSKHQTRTAVRVADIPVNAFEAAIERDKPATVKELAASSMGGLNERPGFSAATEAIGALSRFAKFCAEHDAVFVAGGVGPHEARQCRDFVRTIDAWLDAFVVNLKGPDDEAG